MVIFTPAGAPAQREFAWRSPAGRVHVMRRASARDSAARRQILHAARLSRGDRGVGVPQTASRRRGTGGPPA